MYDREIDDRLYIKELVVGVALGEVENTAPFWFGWKDWCLETSIYDMEA